MRYPGFKVLVASPPGVAPVFWWLISTFVSLLWGLILESKASW